MSSTHYLSVEQLTALGRSLVINLVPEQSRQSLPVPIRGVSGLEIAYFFFPSQASPVNGVKAAPPHFLERLDPTAGTLIELLGVTPDYFHQHDQPSQLLGVFRLPVGMTAQEYLDRRRQLFSLYDRLLPYFAQDDKSVEGVDRYSAQEFLALFELLREPPLMSYYQALGQGYFEWVRRAARKQP
jgi:hypothetical protein